MTTDQPRDLHADLAVALSVPPGPWSRLDGGHDDKQQYIGTPGEFPLLYSYLPGHPAIRWALAASSGWRIAIERALAAEAEVARLRAECAELGRVVSERDAS